MANYRIELRPAKGTGLAHVVFSSSVIAIGAMIWGFMLASISRNDGKLVFSVFALLFLGLAVWHLAGGLRVMNDRDVKLSLTSGGIKDHRTGKWVPWEGFLGMRLWVKSMNGYIESAMMYIKTRGENGEVEVPFEIYGLDKDYELIGHLVQIAALENLAEPAAAPRTTMAAGAGEPCRVVD